MKWEYRSLILLYFFDEEGKLENKWKDSADNTLTVSQRLNELGDEGWELAGTTTELVKGITVSLGFYLKRPKS